MSAITRAIGQAPERLDAVRLAQPPFGWRVLLADQARGLRNYFDEEPSEQDLQTLLTASMRGA